MKKVQARIITFFLLFSLLGIGLGSALCADQININTATEQQLATLPGIGPALATRVMTFRKDHPFTKVDDLMQVKGIGQKVFDKIKALITV